MLIVLTLKLNVSSLHMNSLNKKVRVFRWWCCSM